MEIGFERDMKEESQKYECSLGTNITKRLRKKTAGEWYTNEESEGETTK